MQKSARRLSGTFRLRPAATNFGHAIIVSQFMSYECICYSVSEAILVRNMAVVALASRLTHALRQMAKICRGFQSATEAVWWERIRANFNALWAEYSREIRHGL